MPTMRMVASELSLGFASELFSGFSSGFASEFASECWLRIVSSELSGGADEVSAARFTRRVATVRDSLAPSARARNVNGDPAHRPNDHVFNQKSAAFSSNLARSTASLDFKQFETFFKCHPVTLEVRCMWQRIRLNLNLH